MNSTERTRPSSTATYKTLLLEAMRLRSVAGKNAYRRAKILVQVFNDRDFRADCDNADDWKAAKILDAYIEDLCLRFFDLQKILERFPRASSWRDGRLMRMHQQVLRDNSQPIPSDIAKPTTPRDRKELEQQLEVARREKACAESQRISERDQMLARISELEHENAELRAHLAMLRLQMNRCDD